MLSPKEFQVDPRLKNLEPSHYGKVFLRNKLESSSHLYVKTLNQHTGSVNAIEFDKNNEFLASGGDDTSIILWNIERDILNGQPSASAEAPNRMCERHMSNIFALQFDCQSKTLVSAGNDGIIFLHDMTSGQLVRGMVRTRSVLGLTCHPAHPALLAAAFSDGRVIQYDTRAAERPPATTLLTGCRVASCAVYHPTDERLLMAATAATGVCLVDIRQPMQPCRSVELASSRGGDGSSLHAAFDSDGSHALVVGRRRCPVLYSFADHLGEAAKRVAIFDDSNYYSSCTSKSCCFVGPNDSFVATGSDSCQALLWRRGATVCSGESRRSDRNMKGVAMIDKACLTLTGHQSIVNQVRYCPRFGLLATAGVDTTVRIWSPFASSPDFVGGVNPSDAPSCQRPVHTYADFLASGVGGFLGVGAARGPAYRLAKDRLLAAYFDSLLQRDVCSSAEPDASIDYDDSSDSSLGLSSSDDNAFVSCYHGNEDVGRLERIRPYLPARWTEASESDNSSSELSDSGDNESGDPDCGNSHAGGRLAASSDECLHGYSKRRRGIVAADDDVVAVDRRPKRKRRHGPCGCRIRQFRDSTPTDDSRHRDVLLARLKQLVRDAHQRIGGAEAAASAATAAVFSSSASLNSSGASNPLLSLRPSSMQQLIFVARLLHHRGPMPALGNNSSNCQWQQQLSPGNSRLLNLIADVRTYPCLSWRCHRRFIRQSLCQFAFVLYADCSPVAALLWPATDPATLRSPPPPPPPPPPPDLSSASSSSSSSDSSGTVSDAEQDVEDEGLDGRNMTVARLLQMPVVFFSEDDNSASGSSSSSSSSDDSSSTESSSVRSDG